MEISWWLVAVFVVDLAIRIAAIIIVPRNRRPTAAMAWLLAIYFIPFVGVFLFLLIGNPRLPRARRRKQDRINEYAREAAAQIDGGTLRPNAPQWFQSIVRMNSTFGALPIVGDNDAHLISDYQESLDAMAEEIRTAERFVYIEFYIFQSDASTDNLFRALEEVAARGVTVRVLLDHWANRWKPFYKATLRRLDAMGADWHLMLPVQPLKGNTQRPDLRNHRKLLVVDGMVAYLGSQNVTDSTYNLPKNIKRGLHWVDLMVRLEGPVVTSVVAVFLSDWYSETDTIPDDGTEAARPVSDGDLDCQVVPSGPGFEFENNQRLFVELLHAAQKRISVISPYFVPDSSVLGAITAATARGVAVELFVSEEGDQALVYHAQRSYYEALLRAGITIWMYPKPYILHTKGLMIDDEVAVIGSSNMDMRSFGLNLEVSLLVRGEEFIAELDEVASEYRRLSRQLTAEEWAQQPLRSTVLDNLARLTSALQ
ncbi:cardiolipin synthase [Microbacterium mitrae]|uniref:Cardiolipin synthase n=1 Tax=Microbacterium mitrae TaxID=664640 RepID=A0A5C8HP39_9MICO|nr:cardiolipin synthase [Microbacterium mitrae]TXK04138.1 cardiolipin synthase [Microbacterium mitrae]